MRYYVVLTMLERTGLKIYAPVLILEFVLILDKILLKRGKLFGYLSAYMRNFEIIANDFISIFFKPFLPFDM